MNAMAQSGAPGNPISESIRQAWDDAKENLTQSADVKAEAEHGFKPTDQVRTCGQILAHVASSELCVLLRGERGEESVQRGSFREDRQDEGPD